MYDEKALPEIDTALCDGWGACVEGCPEGALPIIAGGAATVAGLDDRSYCGACEFACPTEAIGCPYEIVIEG